MPPTSWRFGPAQSLVSIVLDMEEKSSITSIPTTVPAPSFADLSNLGTLLVRWGVAATYGLIHFGIIDVTV